MTLVYIIILICWFISFSRFLSFCLSWQMMNKVPYIIVFYISKVNYCYRAVSIISAHSVASNVFWKSGFHQSSFHSMTHMSIFWSLVSGWNLPEGFKPTNWCRLTLVFQLIHEQFTLLERKVMYRKLYNKSRLLMNIEHSLSQPLHKFHFSTWRNNN